jgi:hypothetical protein
MILEIAGCGALHDKEGLDGKSRLCEHRGSLMIGIDHLALTGQIDKSY